MDHHLVARAPQGRLLFRTHTEARELWTQIVRCCPQLIALCLMPNHLHLILPDEDEDHRLHDALSAYARWRNAARGEQGPVFAPRPKPQLLPSAKHLRRGIRYVHMNPTRADLVTDPLAWPWSTHRDRVGLTLLPAVEPYGAPNRFHRYISADPSVDVAGTELPARRPGDFDLEQVIAAVSAACRVLPYELMHRGTPRTLAIQAAWLHGHRDADLLSTRFACDRSSVWRITAGLTPGRARAKTPELATVLRLVGDPRFPALHPGDLRARWGAYGRLV